MCEDQSGNKKIVSYLYFQNGPFDINEDSPGGFSPDGMDTKTVAIGEAMTDISKAHSRAEKCGSMSKFQCFMKNDATETLGKKLCRD